MSKGKRVTFFPELLFESISFVFWSFLEVPLPPPCEKLSLGTVSLLAGNSSEAYSLVEGQPGSRREEHRVDCGHA